jgi:hypothetical protein
MSRSYRISTTGSPTKATVHPAQKLSAASSSTRSVPENDANSYGVRPPEYLSVLSSRHGSGNDKAIPCTSTTELYFRGFRGRQLVHELGPLAFHDRPHLIGNDTPRRGALVAARCSRAAAGKAQ